MISSNNFYLHFVEVSNTSIHDNIFLMRNRNYYFMWAILGHDIGADCIASGCGFTTCAYALIENDVSHYTRGRSRSTL